VLCTELRLAMLCSPPSLPSPPASHTTEFMSSDAASAAAAGRRLRSIAAAFTSAGAVSFDRSADAMEPESESAHSDRRRGGQGSRHRHSPVVTELVPFGFESALFLRSPEAAEHLRWLAQKDALGQDMALIGSSGPLRRWLALHYAAVTGREVEYVALTRDTTESDLKQRRELRVAVGGGRAGGGGGGAAAAAGAAATTSVWVDQSVIEAALHGRILILEGLERAERNVLPVLNNLLENREMVRRTRAHTPQTPGARLSPLRHTHSLSLSPLPASAFAVRSNWKTAVS
jgi:hypothetical protein